MPAHTLHFLRPPRRHVMPMLLAGMLPWLTAACTAAIAAGGPPAEPVYVEEAQEYDGGPLGVPRGHLPPPGECRVWYPGDPPGQQPPPLACGDAMASAEPGTWVLYRPGREEVHARVIDRRRAGVVVEVRVYAAETGRYLRSRRP